MSNELSWADDARGLPPAVMSQYGNIWALNKHGRNYSRPMRGDYTPAQLESAVGPCTPLRFDTPPTSPLPDPSHWHLVPVGAIIPAGMLYAVAWDDGEFGAYRSRDDKEPVAGRSYYTEHPLAAPNLDAELIRTIHDTLASDPVPCVLEEDQIRAMIDLVRKGQS